MSSPVAVVTGPSSGIGEAIAARLLDLGWTVHGLSRRTARFTASGYHHTVVDLTDTAALTAAAESVRSRHGNVTALINNAGVGHFAPHEELSIAQINELVSLNLLAPLALSKLLLRDLKESRGFIVNIASFSALESSSFGAAYAATKAGLLHFGRSLFDETRKSGLRVCTITPDITRTPFYDSLTFSPEADVEAAIEPESIAEAVVQILSQREGTVMSEVVLRPQRVLLKKHPRAKV